jgi:hypothetical protein
MGWFSARCSTCDGSMFLIQRFALLLIFLIPVIYSGTAFADYPKTLVGYKLVFNGLTYNTYQLACTAFVDNRRATYPSENISQSSCSETTVQAAGWSAGPTNYQSAINKMGSCAGVVTQWGTGTCTGTQPVTCTPPLVLDTASNTCKDPCAPLAGQSASYSSATSGGGDSCVSGCVAEMISGNCGHNAAGQQMCFYTGEYTGASCTGAEGGQGSTSDPAPNTPEYDCIKSGKSYGTVNGVVVCVSAGTAGSAPVTNYQPSSTSSGTTSTTSGGTTTSTSTESSGTKVTTYNPDGTVTTQTTNSTVNADGSTTQTTEDKTQAKEDFCAANPASTNCKQQTQCEENPEGPTCKHFCAKYPDTLACSDLKSLKDEINAYSTEGIFQTKNITTTFLKETVPEAQGCPAPINISLGFTSVSIPYDWLCDYASYFRNVVVAFAYLAAITIVFGAFKKE